MSNLGPICCLLQDEQRKTESWERVKKNEEGIREQKGIGMQRGIEKKTETQTERGRDRQTDRGNTTRVIKEQRTKKQQTQNGGCARENVLQSTYFILNWFPYLKMESFSHVKDASLLK